MRTPPRLWIVSELYYPEQTSTGYFLTQIAEGLARSMPVEVVSGQPTYSEHGQRSPRFELRNGVRIHRLRATHFAKDRLMLRAVNAFTLSLAAAWFAITRFGRGDRLLVVTNPPTMPPIVGMVAKWKRIEAHLLVHDVYPDVLIATGFLRRGSYLHRLLERIFSGTFRLFGSIIVLGRDMAEVVRSKLGDADSKITIIPNWGDPEDIAPLPRATNPFLQLHGIDARCIIQISGNIGRTHDLATVIAAAEQLRERGDVLFLFAGQGGKAGSVQDAITSRALGNARLLPRQPRDLLGPMLAGGTAAIISFLDAMKGLSVPSRMYNIMAAGTPIIAMADAQSELAIVVGEENAGWILSPGDVAGLVRLVSWLATPAGEAEAARRGANGRAAVLARYTFDRVLDRFEALLTE